MVFNRLMLFAEVEANLLVTLVSVLVVSVVAPTILSLLTARQAQQSKAAEYKRQDDVAAALEARQDAAEARAREVVAQAERAAQLLVERQDASEERADAAAKRAVEVAEQAAKAAELLLAANERVADQSRAGSAVTSRELAEIRAQGERIHTLVNSQMTEAKTAQLLALVQFVGVTHEMFELLRAAGSEPTAKAVAALEESQKTVDGLRSEIADRVTATRAAEQQAAAIEAAATPDASDAT